MLAFTTISCISQNGAVAEDAARDDLVAICGPVAQTDERFGHKQWKPLETPPADADDLRSLMTGVREVDPYWDQEQWFISDDDDVRLCAMSSEMRRSCPGLYRRCKSDTLATSSGQVFVVGELRTCYCQ